MQFLLGLPLGLEAPVMTPNGLIFLFLLAGLVAVMAKVMVVLVTELAVLPVAYGFWLDVCALPLFEGSLQQRLALLRSAPLTWTLLHWMLGMACLMATAAFLSVARSVLRPGGACSRD